MASVSKRPWIGPDGKKKEAWVVRYVDAGGRQRQKTCRSKKEADAYERQVENELEAGTHVARRDSRLVSELIDEFEADVGRRCNDGKVGRGYTNLCRTNLRYVRPLLGGMLVRDLKWQHVEQMAVKLRDARTRYDRPLSRQSIANIVTLFGTVTGYAARRGYCAANVVPDAVREMGPAAVPAIETFTMGEVRRLLIALETPPPSTQRRVQAQIKAMVYLAVVCGLRRGEIMGLTADHVDFASGVVRVRQALDAWDGVKGPKTQAGVRDVPMPTRVADVVRQYLALAEPDGRGLLFRGRGGAPYHSASFTKVWHALLLRSGFPPKQDSDWRHFHALRHFAGSAWLAGGVPLTEVSRLMGHANAAITARVYAHAIVGTLQRAPELEKMAASVVPQLAADCARDAQMLLTH